jgi:hypothetical protein
MSLFLRVAFGLLVGWFLGPFIEAVEDPLQQGVVLVLMVVSIPLFLRLIEVK